MWPHIVHILHSHTHTHTHTGKCVSIQGTVVRVGNIKPLVTKVVFKCSLCHSIQVVALPDGKYTLPTKVNPNTTIPSSSFSLSEHLYAISPLFACRIYSQFK